MRVLFFILFFLHSVAFSDDYIDSLIEGDDIQVNCSNILGFVNSYLHLSESNQNLLSVSALRFLSGFELFNSEATIGDFTQSDEWRDLKNDVSELTVKIDVLPEMADIIRDVLSDCLSKEN